MAAVIFVLALLMPAALGAGSPGCLDATLPGILDLGTCLGTSVDLCTATVEDVLGFLEKLIQCLITELTNINAVGAVSAFLDIIKLVFSLLGVDVRTLTNLIKPLCVVANVPGCTTILSGSNTCSQPISIKLPGNLNLEQCLDDTLLVCKNGDLATDELLVNLVKAIACLLNALLGSDPGSLINGLACILADLLHSAANANVVLKLTLGGLSASINVAANCS
ncbi:uncharacterized protein LOC144101687 [Amblyomma americanum]